MAVTTIKALMGKCKKPKPPSPAAESHVQPSQHQPNVDQEWIKWNINQVNELLTEAENFKTRNRFDFARDDIEKAKAIFDMQNLSASMPGTNFNDLLKELNICEVKYLIALARKEKGKGDFDSARYNMKRAETLINKENIDDQTLKRRLFSKEELRELDIMQVNKRIKTARDYKKKGHLSLACSGMVHALETFAKFGLTENELAKPHFFTVKEWSKICPGFTAKTKREQFPCAGCYKKDLKAGLQHSACEKICCYDCLTKSGESQTCPSCEEIPLKTK